MKFLNEILIPNPSYTEVGQSNPLRYVFLYRDDNGDFTHTSGEFKCKDYFNEVVSALRGGGGNVYNMDYASTKRNEGVTYVRLLNIINRDVFFSNLVKVNERLVADGFPEFVMEPGVESKDAVLSLPDDLFRTTWTTSLLWYLIRVSNVAGRITNWVAHPTKSIDNPFGSYYTKVMEQGFKPPRANYWYFTEPSCQQDATKMDKRQHGPTYNVHNNGCAGWMSALEVFGDEEELECEE